MTATARRPRGYSPTGVIEPAEADREVAKRVRRRRAHGIFPSRKTGGKLVGHIWFREAIYDCMHVLEADPTIDIYQPRPGKVRVLSEGKRHEREVDFLIIRGGQRTVLDIVEAPDGVDDPKPELTSALREALLERGIGYTLRTVRWVRLQPRFDNSKELVRYISSRVTPETEHRVAALLGMNGGSASRDDLEQALGGRDAARHLLYAMVLKGSLAIDMSRPFSGSTLLNLRDRSERR